MSEITETFTELFFGGGAWLMVIILVAMILVISVRVKHSVVIFIPISIFLGFNYLDNATASNNLQWCAIIMWIVPIFLILIEFQQRKG